MKFVYAKEFDSVDAFVNWVCGNNSYCANCPLHDCKYCNTTTYTERMKLGDEALKNEIIELMKLDVVDEEEDDEINKLKSENEALRKEIVELSDKLRGYTAYTGNDTLSYEETIKNLRRENTELHETLCVVREVNEAAQKVLACVPAKASFWR